MQSGWWNSAAMFKFLKSYLRFSHGHQIEATASNDGGRVFLAWSSLEACIDPDEVATKIQDLLPRLEALLHVYACADGSGLTVKNVFWVDGDRLKQRMRQTININVISSKGLKELGATTKSGSSLGSALLDLSTKDDRVSYVLDFLGGKDRGWYELYDLIDAMGNVDRLVKRGWATRASLSAIRQTANHYRHRGSRAAKYHLPKNPPSFSQARATIAVFSAAGLLNVSINCYVTN